MHDGMQYDPMQGQGHKHLKVGNPSIFNSYLCHLVHRAVKAFGTIASLKYSIVYIFFRIHFARFCTLLAFMFVFMLFSFCFSLNLNVTRLRNVLENSIGSWNFQGNKRVGSLLTNFFQVQ